MDVRRLFLTREELVELTGYSQHKKQISCLVQMGMPFELAGGVRPVVLREAVVQHLSAKSRRTAKARAEPNFQY